VFSVSVRAADSFFLLKSGPFCTPVFHLPLGMSFLTCHVDPSFAVPPFSSHPDLHSYQSYRSLNPAAHASSSSRSPRLSGVCARRRPKNMQGCGGRFLRALHSYSVSFVMDVFSTCFVTKQYISQRVKQTLISPTYSPPSFVVVDQLVKLSLNRPFCGPFLFRFPPPPPPPQRESSV